MSDKKTNAVIRDTGTQGGGLARAILTDPECSAIHRACEHAQDPHRQGTSVAAAVKVWRPAMLDDQASLERAFAGAHGAFLVTNFWEHLSTERESTQAAAMARATKAAGVAHAVWSTLEDTRLSFPLDDPRLKTLHGKYKVPHFDAKGESDAIFAAEGAPTQLIRWRRSTGRTSSTSVRARDRVPTVTVLRACVTARRRRALPGIAAEDIGRCAHGIFLRGPDAAGQRFGIAGEVLSGPEVRRRPSRATFCSAPVSFYDMPFDDYRALGFPGADDMGNVSEHHAILGEAFRRHRSPEVARALNPAAPVLRRPG